ncbi:membrane dipeptidase [Cohnella kolymensis]|uniref:Membrane dipeptidase n=1 Tax=Cohnella kolymensis TaxID=1590652 RepID=A0ABR5A3R7_9BACL|nr:membrane dipeptidase [Cohnella kolymensis]KIL35696.1 membrane dipeptidase [Cohnella kolymensis]
MRVADLHVDVLCKMLEHPDAKWSEADSPQNSAGAIFDATPERLRQGGVMLQVFALYVPDKVPGNPESVMHAAELYWSQVLTVSGIKLIRSAADLKSALNEGTTGALLSLEGVDALQGNFWTLKLLHRLGLRLLGPTWNHANWACDGAMEPRGGGFTKAGRQLISECQNLGILIDVSHLSDQGFWEIANCAARPFFASHSNCRAIRNHPRNLTDSQIQTLLSAGGLIGLTFVPWFLTSSEPANINDIMKHIEHICALGGANQVGFGSDFDGVDRHVQGLEHPGRYTVLADTLLRHYPESVVKGIMGENAVRFLIKNLPN